jgi:hypothetical protein
MDNISKKQDEIYNEMAVNKTIFAFFKKYRVGSLLKSANAYKHSGVAAVTVFMYLVQLVFTKKSMYMNIANGTNPAKFAKDVVYRFLNATFINWTKFLLSLSMAVIKNISALTSDERLNVLVVDDSPYERGRSKKVELLANVHDHAAKGKNKYKRGFRMLTLGWSDGATFIPMMFRHLSSGKQKNRYNEINPGIDKRSVGYTIRKEAISSATEVLTNMLKQAKKIGVPAKHVLFDSWFSFPSVIMSIREVGFDIVCRLKDTSKIMYMVKDSSGEYKKQTLKQIYRTSKKRRGKSKYLLSVEVLLYNDKGETIPARLVFVRNRANRKKWIAFASTDMSLSEEQIIQLYGKRWDIEVFFKICKSYLKLAGEFQGLSYDSITAHTVAVMTRYIVIAVQKRQNEDFRSCGELFFLYCDEIADLQFLDALTLILDLLKDTLDDCLFLTEEQIDIIIYEFIAKLSVQFKDFFSRFERIKKISQVA